MADGNSIYAFFVGIDQYQYQTRSGRNINLYGCVNDVELISGLLKRRYNIPDAKCHILTNEQATKQNIINGFRKHLAQADKDDTAIFYYSGHGSTEKTDQRMWANERDHHNETLVCHDSRSREPYDLADKELRYLIHQLSEKGVKVITIIDSCHSGNATRYLEDEEPDGSVTRQLPNSKQARPLDSYVFFTDPQAKHWLNDFSKMPEGNHIALSACRRDQLSKEDYVKRTKYGVFTYNFCQALKFLHFAPSYRNLVDAAGQQVALMVQNQNPQVESIGEQLDIHQTFLSEDIQPVVYPIRFDAGSWWLNAGLAQGINPQARLALLNESGEKAAEISVANAAPEDSVTQGSRLIILNHATLDENVQYQAKMIDPAIEPLAVSLTGAEQHITLLQQELEKSNARYHIRATATNADYQLNADAQSITFSRQNGLPLDVDPVVSIQGNPTREWVALQLAAHMAQWEHTKRLTYVLREEDMPENLAELVISQYDPVSNQYLKLPNRNNVFDLYYQQISGSGDFNRPSIRLSVALNCDVDWSEDQDVFISLLFMDPIKGITKILANKVVLRAIDRRDQDGYGKVGKAANPVWNYSRTVKGIRKETHTLSIPKPLLANDSGQTTDYLKLVVSNFEIDISTLKQGSLEKLLDKLNPTDSRRGSKSMDDDEDLDSGFLEMARTQTFTLNIIQPARPQALRTDQAITLLKNTKKSANTTSDKLIQVLPHTLPALINLEYAGNNPKNFTALRIELDETQNRSVSDDEVSVDNPLQLEVATTLLSTEHEGLLVFGREAGTDGFEIPLGFASHDPLSGNTRITINQLPLAEATSTRSIGGSLLLFFKKITYEKLKIDRDTVQLAIPQFISPHSLEACGYIKDIEAVKKQVTDADKILLFIHGITGDTEQMAGVINREVDGKRLGDGYLALTFDYESLNTPIQETADLLRKKLAAVGLTEEHGKELVIVAHSMGGLVARWMLEKDPACPTVTQLIMLGTPNGGSPLQNMKKWLLVMITLATNGVVGVAGGIGVAGLMYMLKNVDNTLDEMRSDSKTLQYLYEAGDPKVPYFMIAGDTADLRVQLNDERSRLNRLLSVMKQYSCLGVMDFLTAHVFREENDMAAGHGSMVHIPREREFEMEVIGVECDHFSYFCDKETIQHLSKII